VKEAREAVWKLKESEISLREATHYCIIIWKIVKVDRNQEWLTQNCK